MRITYYVLKRNLHDAIRNIFPLFIIFLLAACRPTTASTSAIPLATSGSAHTTVATQTAALPPPIYTIAAPTQEMPSFALPQTPASEMAIDNCQLSIVNCVSPVPTQSPIANRQSPTPPPSPTDTPLGPTLTPSITPTPQPTYTRPAAPSAADWEHYWLNRPVPITGTVWTNKIYSYGSTRGGSLRTHHGVEFDVPAGTPIFAAAAGTVVAAGPDGAVAYGPTTNFYGNVVVIQHEWLHNGQPVFTLYGHLSQVEVVVGQQVAAQEQIALSGASGVADGPHLHFEVRAGQNSYDTTRNPLLWLYPFPDRGVIAGRVTWPGGALVQNAPITLRRVDGLAPYAATTSYADATVHPDAGWNENFALDDVYAGYYEVIVSAGDKEYKVTTWVYPYQTSFVEIVLEEGE